MVARSIAWCALAAVLVPQWAAAHGLWGHIHVTGWAVENMPDDELRAFLYDDPEVFNALLFGATFADTGYARDVPGSREYSEHAHWEPFVEDFVEWIRVNDPPPWTTPESKRRVAFLLGCASHGLQDSIFDSLFLAHIEEHDGAGQEEADPGTDGFLVADGHIRFLPEQDIPMTTVLELFAEVSPDISEEVISGSVRLTTAAYINDELGLSVAEGFAARYADIIPWARGHYLDASVPGSLRSEIYPTMRYQQAIWDRLHDRFDANGATVYAFPDAPRRLRTHMSASTGSWVTLVFGAGVRYEGDLVELLDAEGAVVPFSQANTRWGADHTRLLRILPTEDLQPGGWYTARLRDGAALIGGETSTEPWEITFQVACEESDDPQCPPVVPAREPSIDGIPEVPAEAETDGCGCASSGSAFAPWWLLPVLAWRRRSTRPAS